MRNWSFRRRLSMLISVVFFVGVAALLVMQYLVFRSIMYSTSAQVFTWDPGAMSGDHTLMSGGIASSEIIAPEILVPEGPIIQPNELPESGISNIAMMSCSTSLNEQVMQNLLIWSVVILVAFAGIAVLAGNWLASRSLGRIAQINKTLRGVSGRNRGARLALDGPTDEIKELGDTIDQTLDRLDYAMTRQERFIAAASHELRTPLATARTSLEIPFVQGRFSADTVRSVERALAAGRRSEELLSALLALASVQTRAPEPVTIIQIGSAYIDALRQSSALAAEHDVDLTWESVEVGTAEVEPDEGDETTLLQIAFENLIRNAVFHNLPGGSAHAALVFGRETVTLRVENDGEPLTDQQVELLREPFNRGANTQLSGGGLGLGLTVVQAVADHFEGSLDLERRSSGGLLVTFTVPAANI